MIIKMVSLPAFPPANGHIIGMDAESNIPIEPKN